MIVTKENGTIYNDLTKAVIDFHIENNMQIADVNRLLKKDEDGNYVDDITAEEVKAGYELIRSFMYREITDPMFFKVQRGEIEESEWLNAIQEIKDEWKY